VLSFWGGDSHTFDTELHVCRSRWPASQGWDCHFLLQILLGRNVPQPKYKTIIHKKKNKIKIIFPNIYILFSKFLVIFFNFYHNLNDIYIPFMHDLREQYHKRETLHDLRMHGLREVCLLES
jgi:hypothetical protein